MRGFISRSGYCSKAPGSSTPPSMPARQSEPTLATAVDQLEEGRRDRLRRRRAAGDAEVEGEQGVDRPDELVLDAEEVAAESAVTEGGDEPGFGHRTVGGEERL